MLPASLSRDVRLHRIVATMTVRESDVGIPWSVPFALVLLRAGLGYFLLVWGVNKFLTPKQTVAIWAYFYGVDIDVLFAHAFGIGETMVAIAITLGLWRRASYGAGLLIHAVTIVIVFEHLAAPFIIEDGFPVNRSYAVSVPVLMGFAALYLLRRYDAWSFDVWWGGCGGALKTPRDHGPSDTRG